MAYTPKKYTHVQLIAYQTPTFFMTKDDPPPAVFSLPPQLHTLQHQDEKSRITRMYMVTAFAAGQKHVDKSPGTLKVFVAPEFYFKVAKPSADYSKSGSPGKYGAYSFNVMQNMLACLKAVYTSQSAISLGTLRNWMIVPGTIVSEIPWKSGKYQDVNTYLNTAPVIKAGEKDAPFHFVQKHYVSSIDGPPMSRGLFVKGGPYEAALAKLKKSGLDDDKARFFTMDNISFGLEVCLDHAMGVLKGTCDKSFIKHRPDIHLVISCGMTLHDDKVTARSNGYAMICDGIQPLAGIKKVVVAGQSLGPYEPADAAVDIPKPLQVTPDVGATAVYYKNGGAAWGGSDEPAKTKDYLFPERIVYFKPVKVK